MVDIYYLDLLWVVNVFIHLVLFAGTARLMKRKISKRRLWSVSILGSCSIFIVLTPFESLFFHPVGKFILSIVLVLTAFGYGTLKIFMKSVFMFYVISFLAAGTITALETMRFSLRHSQGFLTEQTVSMYSSFSLVLISIAVPLLWMTFKWTDNITKSRDMKWKKTADISIEIEGQLFKGAALVDTGNQLKDPVTRTPVMVMQLSMMKEQLPVSEYEKILTMIQDRRMEDLENIENWEGRWRLIPYRTAGQDLQMMFALKPDVVSVYYDEQHFSFDSVLVGLEHRSLSSDGDFQMIFPSDPLQESAHVSA